MFFSCKHIAFALLFLFSFIPFGHALTPPLYPGELMEDADLVVEGEVVGEVACLGKTVENKCFTRFDYQAEIRVAKALKGKAKKKKAIPVHFYHNDFSKSKCVGDQGAALHSGDVGTFYLKKSEEGYYYPFHWSAVDLKTQGTAPWPACK